MTILPALLAAALLALVAAPARAQAPAPLLPEDPRAPRFEEVERGLHAGFETGFVLLLETPVADPAKYPFAREGGGRATGMLVGASLGHDLGERLTASLFALGASAEASRSYGAFGLFVTGLDLRATLARWSDRNGVPRLHLYLHGRGGYALLRPTGLLGTSDLLVGGGPGLEYFTRLRHFSIGLAVDGLWLARAGAAGLAVSPTVRYTF